MQKTLYIARQTCRLCLQQALEECAAGKSEDKQRDAEKDYIISYSNLHAFYQLPDGTTWAEHGHFYDQDDLVGSLAYLSEFALPSMHQAIGEDCSCSMQAETTRC